METSGTDILNDSETQAPVSPLHLAVSSSVPGPLSVRLALKLNMWPRVFESPRRITDTVELWRSCWPLCWT